MIAFIFVHYDTDRVVNIHFDTLKINMYYCLIKWYADSPNNVAYLSKLTNQSILLNRCVR